MRNDLRINFGNLENISTKSQTFANSLETLSDALRAFNSAVDNNAGKAATRVKKLSPNISDNIEKLVDGLKEVDGVIKNYDADMSAYIMPVNNKADLFIDCGGVKSDLKQLISELETFRSLANSCTVPNLPNVVTTQVATSDPEREFSLEQYNEAKTYIKKLEEVREKMLTVANEISSKYSDELSDILKKVENYLETDKDYENKAEKAYEDYADLKWYQTTVGKICIGTVAVAAGIALAIFAAPVVAAVGGALGLSSGAIALTTTIVAGAAKGAVIGAITTSTLDVGSAVINGEDIDSAFADGMLAGVASGTISGGLGAASGNIVAAGSKYVQMSEKGVKLAERGVNIAGGVLGDAAEAGVKGEDFNVIESTIKNTGSEALSAGKDYAFSKVDEMVSDIDEVMPQNSGNQKALSAFEKVEKGALNVAENEAKNVLESTVDTVSSNLEDGNGLSLEGYENNSLLSSKNSEEFVNKVVTGEGYDANSITDNYGNKVFDYIERGFGNSGSSGN